MIHLRCVFGPPLTHQVGYRRRLLGGVHRGAARLWNQRVEVLRVLDRPRACFRGTLPTPADHLHPPDSPNSPNSWTPADDPDHHTDLAPTACPASTGRDGETKGAARKEHSSTTTPVPILPRASCFVIRARPRVPRGGRDFFFSHALYSFARLGQKTFVWRHDE